MKRDMDLVRLVLIQVEEGEAPEEMSRYSEEQILYHCGLTIEAGLVEGEVVHGHNGQIVGAAMIKLTWAGHDFLDAARSESIWSKAKEKILSAGGGWTLELLKALLLQEAKQSLGLSTDP